MTSAEIILYSVVAFIVGGLVGYAFFGNLTLDEEGIATLVTMIFSRNLEMEIPVILAVLKVLYDNNMLDAINELAK